MGLTRYFALAVVCGCIFPAVVIADDGPNAVNYKNCIYVSLDTVLDLMNGSSRFTPWARGIQISADGKQWEFANGGDRLKTPEGEIRLRRSVLVVDGKHFVPLEECSGPIGFRVRNEPELQISVGDRHVVLRPPLIDSEFECHTVRDLKPVHEAVVVRKDIVALKSLHSADDRRTVKSGTAILVRRTVRLDGIRYAVATDCGPTLQSYLIGEKELRRNADVATLKETAWGRFRRWFEKQSKDKSGLRHGPRQELESCVALTIDLCWSLRAFERDFFRSLPDVAARRGNAVHPVLFVSGRWLEQHPTEMHDLIEMGQRSEVEFTWGLHSWAHPKSGGFMNDFAVAELRDDTLRLEQQLLEWGIVPTVYYRFPGLIHDRFRLQAILDLDLFPIDCDAWLAVQGTSHPYGNPIQDGSIILIHGNGNEPQGIPLLNHWLTENSDWRIPPLHAFFPTVDTDG